MFGKDGTQRHDEIVAEVTDIEYFKSFYVCRNHLHLYAMVKGEFSIHAIVELSPRQSTFSLDKGELT
jgi:hypothetical protein